ncbi:unnamed protein product [Choristocarpus tenellus]
MRQQEDKGVPSGGSGGGDGGGSTSGRGMLWKDVVTWYCQQHQAELSREDDLYQMQKLVSQVIKRLITKDGYLVYQGDPDEDALDEDKLIAVHPNFDVP